ncbi:uncharacterized protein H6S33_010500 [Morchella sextelata]|uniref:uncharacterized protein n=1 Tax=Morchella sextelata TaxID=1174677 RepID=UPI001D043F94|nr:uncharacterized protein H6S33_010500 [Morchella sextelata]KAH0612448.1 hypothetical protein H6S33_010500 [Morchella sextelata]
MNCTEQTYERGTPFCRQADWKDVVRFMILNFALHAVTVITPPGSSIIITVFNTFSSILMPAVGFDASFKVLYRMAVLETTHLRVALRSEALCMLVPSDPCTRKGPDSSTSPAHGQTRSASTSATRRLDSEKDDSETDSPGALEDKIQPAISGQEVVPSGAPLVNWEEYAVYPRAYRPVIPLYTQVHGQYPTDIKVPGQKYLATHNKDRERKPNPEADAVDYNTPSHADYSLIYVPHWFEVHPLANHSPIPTEWEKVKRWWAGEKVKPPPGSMEPSTLSSNYSFVKTCAAMFQIVYASFELYMGSKRQIVGYGYAAYSLAVIPYILMSLTNLLASLTAPRYPAIYIVKYGGLKPPGKYKNGETRRTGESSKTGKIAQGQSEISGTGGEAEWPQGWWTPEDMEEVEGKVTGAVGIAYGDFRGRRGAERQVEGEEAGGANWRTVVSVPYHIDSTSMIIERAKI